MGNYSQAGVLHTHPRYRSRGTDVKESWAFVAFISPLPEINLKRPHLPSLPPPWRHIFNILFSKTVNRNGAIRQQTLRNVDHMAQTLLIPEHVLHTVQVYNQNPAKREWLIDSVINHSGLLIL